MPTLYQSQYPLAWPRHDWRQGTFRAPSILPIANLQDLQFWTCDATPDSPFSNFGNLFTILIRRELSTKLIHDHKNLTPPQVCLFEHWGPGRIRTLRQHIHDASKYHLQIVAKDRLFSSFANLLFSRPTCSNKVASKVSSLKVPYRQEHPLRLPDWFVRVARE